MNNHILIGAMIGLFVSLLLTWISIISMYREAEKHKRWGREVKVDLYYGPIIIKSLMFTLFGAIVGYFI